MDSNRREPGEIRPGAPFSVAFRRDVDMAKASIIGPVDGSPFSRPTRERILGEEQPARVIYLVAMRLYAKGDEEAEKEI